MRYREILEAYHRGETVPHSEMSGIDLFFLIYDGYEKEIEFNGNLYEINIIDVDKKERHRYIAITREKYSTYQKMEELLMQAIVATSINYRCFISYGGEPFEIIVEPLETNVIMET